jgi:hypothetical protein
MASIISILLLSLAFKVQALKHGPVEVVTTPKPMRFEYKDSFSLFYLENAVCEGSILAVRNQNYNIKALALENVASLMVTNTQITNCSAINWVGCPSDAAYCQYFTADRLVDIINSKAYLFTSTPCGDELFFYVYPEDKSARGTAILLAEKITKACEPAYLDFCAAQPYNDCNTNEEARCAVVDCLRNGNHFRGYCLAKATDETAYAACNSNAEWAIDDDHDLTIMVLDIPESYRIGTFLLSVVILAFLSTCCCSIYYRYRLKTDGFAPFSPPTYCPSFLFPLPEYLEADFASINNGMVPLRILRAAD